MSDDKNPSSHLRIVSENDQSSLNREWAKRQIETPLRELAANIIRIVRGAGKSYEIGGQCVGVVEAFQRYRERVGHWPPAWEIDEALSISREIDNPTYDHWWEQERALDMIVRGAMQVSASRLIGQSTQERRGESELYDGVRRLEKAREAARKQLAEEQKVQRQNRRQASAKSPRTRRKSSRRPSDSDE